MTHVLRPDIAETAALGAARVAGVAAGAWKDGPAFISGRKYTTFRPRRSRADASSAIRGWQRAVRAALHWAGDQK